MLLEYELTESGILMAQRCSEYARVDADTYVTPGWVWDALFSIEEFDTAWDPAPQEFELDFLKVAKMPTMMTDIVTNPPFRLSDEFVRHALHLTKMGSGKVAMLLPHTWDTARKRTDLFGVPFRAKYILTRRIRWENLDQKKNGPSTNHAWYVWDWKYTGEPKMGWLNGQRKE